MTLTLAKSTAQSQWRCKMCLHLQLFDEIAWLGCLPSGGKTQLKKCLIASYGGLQHYLPYTADVNLGKGETKLLHSIFNAMLGTVRSWSPSLPPSAKIFLPEFYLREWCCQPYSITEHTRSLSPPYITSKLQAPKQRSNNHFPVDPRLTWAQLSSKFPQEHAITEHRSGEHISIPSSFCKNLYL